VRETACDITMVATVLEVKGRRHALIAAVLHNSGGSGPSVDELRNPVLHWGCVGGHGKGWSTPPPGWSSWPKNSHDAREFSVACSTPLVLYRQAAGGCLVHCRPPLPPPPPSLRALRIALPCLPCLARP
jgi:hypothetical protein